ncbi:hypothetical protein RF11_03754 [Thelohanellus kitauei]|uniref:Uncharacterized protein n=1 Tax=Thelohanellus kitauei TaxID=669202 RepID=A0A0C2JS24_THEKT|nr:hypothetical protein RF11_03754 [Thelohanellus kitauei]
MKTTTILINFVSYPIASVISGDEERMIEYTSNQRFYEHVIQNTKLFWDIIQFGTCFVRTALFLSRFYYDIQIILPSIVGKIVDNLCMKNLRIAVPKKSERGVYHNNISRVGEDNFSSIFYVIFMLVRDIRGLVMNFGEFSEITSNSINAIGFLRHYGILPEDMFSQQCSGRMVEHQRKDVSDKIWIFRVFNKI